MSRDLRAACLGLILVCAGVLWLRTRHIDYLLPHQIEPDRYAVAQVELLRSRATGNTEPAPYHFYFYPMLLARVHLALSETTGPARVEPGEDALRAHLEAANGAMLRSRTLVAWMSVLGVAGTFLIALRFTGPWTALLAAALAGTSFLHLVFSGQARPHGMATSWIVLAVATALWMRRRPTPRTYVAGGIAGALAICALQNGSAALIALVAAWFLRDRARERGRWTKILLLPVLIGGAALFFYPFFVERAERGTTQSYSDVAIEEGVLKGGGHEIPLELFRGKGFTKLDDFLAWNDPLLLWGGLAGIALALIAVARRRGRLEPGRWPDALVVLAHALPYFVMLGVFGKTRARYLLPLIPYLAILSAYAFTRVTRPVVARASGTAARAGITAVLAAAALAWPLRVDLKLVELRGVPDTQELAARWVVENVAPEEVVATGPGLILPLFSAPEELAQFYRGRQEDRWLEYQADHAEVIGDVERWRILDPFFTPQGARTDVVDELQTLAGARAWLQGLEADWLVMETSQRLRSFFGSRGTKNLLKALEEVGPPALRIEPRPHGAGELPRPRHYQDQERAVERALSAERLGPPLEIYGPLR